MHNRHIDRSSKASFFLILYAVTAGLLQVYRNQTFALEGEGAQLLLRGTSMQKTKGCIEHRAPQQNNGCWGLFRGLLYPQSERENLVCRQEGTSF